MCMADYIFIRKSRNAFSSFLHIALNIILGAGSILITLISGSWFLGIFLVLISKWRVFAVRPRYWFLNIKSSLVDLIVGSSFVFLAYIAGTDILPIHIILAVLYPSWLIFIKPRTSELATFIQSLFAVFFGTTASILVLSTLPSSINSIAIILAEFIIGYSASRHIFSQFSTQKNYTLITFVVGLCFAEISLLLHSWSIIYAFDPTGIMIPQASIILSLAFFAIAKSALSLSKTDGIVKHSEILPPAIFSFLIISIILLFFSNPIFNV